MPTYSMSEIVALTNFNAHTLRKWETRYNFISPQRTETNIRFYTDDQLRKLLNIGILLNNNYKVSQIDKMSEKEIHDIITQILLKSTPEDDINALIVSMLEMNEIVFNEIMRRHTARNGLMNTITNLIYPFLSHVGVLWGTKKVMPAQEHFISNLIKQKILSTIDTIPIPGENTPKIVLFLMEDETHEIGLLLAYYLAKELGWRVYYLGQNVPVENIKEVINITQPQLIMTMITIQRPAKIQQLISTMAKYPSIPFAISGNYSNQTTSKASDNIILLKNPEEFISILNQKKLSYDSRNQN